MLIPACDICGESYRGTPAYIHFISPDTFLDDKKPLHETCLVALLMAFGARFKDPEFVKKIREYQKQVAKDEEDKKEQQVKPKSRKQSHQPPVLPQAGIEGYKLPPDLPYTLVMHTQTDIEDQTNKDKKNETLEVLGKLEDMDVEG